MKKILFLLSIIIVFFACTSEGNSSSGDGYDRTALLTDWANNIIVPSFVNYQTKVNSLKTSSDAFITTPNQTNLEALRTSWLEAYRAYQSVALFEIGKAEEINFVNTSNTYPTDVTGIEANITAGNADLNLISQFSKQGFPALDYMLFGLSNSDSTILEFYTTHTAASKYKAYLEKLVNRLKENSDAVVTSWNTGYKSSFIASNGNSPSSSVNTLVNVFVEYYERHVRAGKVGIPAGVFSTNTTFTNKVEAYYKNDISKLLLTDAVTATKDFFNGKHFGSAATGLSLKTYLEYLKVSKNNQPLGTIINNQFEVVATTNGSLGNSFSQQIVSNNTKMLEAYDELQKIVQYFKVDMMAALNISVNYADADGD